MEYDTSQQLVSWFNQRNRDGDLILNPPFQRRPVWTRRQQSHLIESILMGLPIPEIYMQYRTTPDGNTEYIVVDGQQRIRAILEFIGQGGDEGFELQYLSDESDWRNRSFKELTPGERVQFFGQRLAVRELRNATTEEVKDLFRRLNKYLTKLSPQELRNATYAGPFVALAEDLAETPYWAENRIVSPQSIRRMGDIEFASELIIGIIHGPQGGSAKIIDDYYHQYEEYEDEIPSQALVKRRFNRTLDTIQELFPDIRETRWHNKTDFYTLFVAIAHLLRTQLLPEDQFDTLSTTLSDFADHVDSRLADELSAASEDVISYVRAVEKGSSEKARRSVRHVTLLDLISPYFKKRA